MSKELNIPLEVDHLFRKESGKMVSVLVNIFGSEHFELAEDVVQNTVIKALETWKFKGMPENPTAWLYRVAKNQAIDVIRRENKSSFFDFSSPKHQLLNSEFTLNSTVDDFFDKEHIQDDYLAMMFAACHPDISAENQITFVLKTLCGFSIKEIASAFITTEDVINKRLYRTKTHFRKNNLRPTVPTEDQLQERLGVVLRTIYLIFNEGYSASNHDKHIREDLIHQSLYLTNELLESNQTKLPQVYSLMALICFNAARIDSRTDDEGSVVLLKDQDRSKWNTELIEFGGKQLIQAGNDHVSSYYFQALIAFQHCIAPSFEETNWKIILTLYDSWLVYEPDPVIQLNRTLVVGELQGAEEALKEMDKIVNKPLLNYYLYHSIKGEFYIQLSDKEKAMNCLEKAQSLTSSAQEKAFIQQKMDNLS